jgi:hypothetical protein
MATLTLTYITPEGILQKTIEEHDAIASIRSLCSLGKWLYIDNEYIQDIEALTLDTLKQATLIVISNPLIGA